jgi:hypothetical protein
LRLRERRRRDSELRRRALFLSLTLFAILWIGVFAQMVSGHDPALGSGTASAGAKPTAQRTARHRRARPPKPQSTWVIDPETGVIERVPSDAATPAPAPVAPAPVVTSQS